MYPQIGITERGDASQDMSWVSKLSLVNGVILITKYLTDNFLNTVIGLYPKYPNMLIHATCTGWGKSPIEPNAPRYDVQIQQLVKLIQMGFPADHTVLRIDPIWPTNNGIQRAVTVIKETEKYSELSNIRIRFSVLDQYPHVKTRFQNAGYPVLHNGSFQAPGIWMKQISTALSSTGHFFECCAEPNITGRNIKHQGCISETELELFNLPITEQNQNPQNRRGCLCLSCKKELLSNRKPCPMNCIYCYWKNPNEL